VHPLTALEQRIAARTSASVTKHFFSACSIVALNIDLTYLNAMKPMKKFLSMYCDYQFIPFYLHATSYFACQLHGEFALSTKQRLCKRRPNISFIFDLALASLHNGNTTLNFIIEREEKINQMHEPLLKKTSVI
jgi:hypothetical protein